MCTAVQHVQYVEAKSFLVNENKTKIKIVFANLDILFDNGNNDNLNKIYRIKN